MNVTNNNAAADIARAFEAWGREERRKEKEAGGEGNDNQYVVAQRYEDAVKWWHVAAGLSIGHNRTARYEEAAARCQEIADIARKRWEKKQGGDA